MPIVNLMSLLLGGSLTIHGSFALDFHAILAQDGNSEGVIARMDAWQSILSGMVDLISLQSKNSIKRFMMGT